MLKLVRDVRRESDVPVNPTSFRALTVRRTCSMHGLKQHIRVVRSFCRWEMLAEHLEGFGKRQYVRVEPSWRVRRRPMGLGDQGRLDRQDRLATSEMSTRGCVPESAVSTIVKPSLQTLRWVRVTTSAMPWRINSSLSRCFCDA
jgi:hypothetical protein